MMNLMQLGLAVQQATVDANKLEVLRQMIDAHDLTFCYSDDSKRYSRGHQQAVDITNYVKDNGIDRKTFAELWNSNVDKKIGEGFRSDYYMAIDYA